MDPIRHLFLKEWGFSGGRRSCVEWAFDDANRRTQMTLDSPTVHQQRNFAYNSIDQLTTSNTSTKPAVGNATNTTNNYALDENDNRTKLNNTNYTTNLADQTTQAGTDTLSFDKAGSVTQTTGNTTASYTYDFKDQLTKFTSGPTTVSYVYDINNKMTSRTVAGATNGTVVNSTTANGTISGSFTGGTFNGTVTIGTTAHGNITFSIASGNTTNGTIKGTVTISNLSGTANTITATINGTIVSGGVSGTISGATANSTISGTISLGFLGDTIHISIGQNPSDGTTTFLWDGGQITKEYDSGGNVTKRYLGNALYQNGHWHLLMTDHQGSTVGVADDQQRLEVTNLYADFGALNQQFKAGFAGALTDVDPMWTGQRLDSVTGNYYMLNRQYVPSLGKFLQRDPARYGGGDNMYAFGGGDAINRVDPSGLDDVPVGPPPGVVVGSPPPLPDVRKETLPGPPPWAGPVQQIDRDMAEMRDLRNAPPLPGWVWDQPIQPTAVFYDYVKKGGPWDYATTYMNRYPDEKVTPQDLLNYGNFHYGATGHALGVSDTDLQMMAGWAQRRDNAKDAQATWNPPGSGWPYGDSLADNYWIRMGIEYAKLRDQGVPLDQFQFKIPPGKP